MWKPNCTASSTTRFFVEFNRARAPFPPALRHKGGIVLSILLMLY